MKGIRLGIFGGALLLASCVAHAHSVVPVIAAKRISADTAAQLDPQRASGPVDPGTDTRAKIGDVLTFIIQFTAVSIGATRGAGGYITEYVPPNTQVVGARLIDAFGNTVAPRRGGLMDDGWGPRGRHAGFDTMGLAQGSLSQLYADTGIFFSSDPRTARTPANATITVTNGIVVNPAPTGGGQLDQFLGFTGPPFYAHNTWDMIQAIAYGATGGSVVAGGTGNTPFGFGSAVAGPDTHYAFEKVQIPACSDGIDNDGDGFNNYPNDPQCGSSLDDDETAAAAAPVGPWRRIRSLGAEIGTGGATECRSCQGGPVRSGVATNTGWNLSPDNPLPAGTNAVRFAVGELTVGQAYFAEVSLRVTALPLDPVLVADVNCAEVFGGDGAMPQNGKDNPWRYFVPAPACVALNLLFDLSVDKLIALTSSTLTYTIRGKNLSVNPQTNVVVRDTFNPADVAFVTTLQGPAPTVGSGVLTWPVMTLAPGAEYTFRWNMNVTGSNQVTENRAQYASDQRPAPGFMVLALTTTGLVVVIEQDVAVTTTPVSSPPSTSAGSNVHYTATISNTGSGFATVTPASFVAVTLPTGFAFCPPPTCAAPKINGADVANPTIAGNTLRFTSGLVGVPPGGTLTLEFDATVGAGVMPGLHTVNLQTQFRDSDAGLELENSAFGIAPLLVDVVRSLPPMLDQPVIAGASQVGGVTSEGAGATVRVFVNGIPATAVTAGTGGVFSASVPTLFVGQRLNATAQAPTEIESVASTPDVRVIASDAIFKNGFEAGP